ncbi:MAG: DUF1045 domain-containing protein [Aestuariivita sp.]|nr:DUF1045 domain-containing protein [Aestuariivita sp.]
MTTQRYAVFFVPETTDRWANFCTSWLGWDSVTGNSVSHPEISMVGCTISALTDVPRRYGLHATLKPPFRLAPEKSERTLEQAIAELTGTLAPICLDSLEITRLNRMLMLTAVGFPSTINHLSARLVMELDCHRAALTDLEFSRHKPDVLTPAQTRNLNEWGYPYVLDEYRFHITLTSKLPRDELSHTELILAKELKPKLPRPIHINNISLMREDDNGYFHLLKRFPLGAASMGYV